jgi:hypothetical protein
VTGELLLALEVTALAAFTFSRPVLDAFGRSPETFIARHASTLDIVAFGLVVAFAPAVIVAVVGGITRVFGPDVRLRSTWCWWRCWVGWGRGGWAAT